MGKRMRIGALAAGMVFASLGAAAIAGDGFDCRNGCPLAKSAGERRAYGREGGAAVQKALTVLVQRNLARV